MSNNSSQQIVDGYLAIILDEKSQQLLLKRFPALYPKVFAHHVTVAFKPPMDVYDQYKAYLGQPVTLQVRAYAKDDKCQAVGVEAVGADVAQIFKNKKYHITISTNGVAPFYSNVLLEKGYEPVAGELTLAATFEFIEHKPRV